MEEEDKIIDKKAIEMWDETERDNRPKLIIILDRILWIIIICIGVYFLWMYYSQPKFIMDTNDIRMGVEMGVINMMCNCSREKVTTEFTRGPNFTLDNLKLIKENSDQKYNVTRTD